MLPRRELRSEDAVLAGGAHLEGGQGGHPQEPCVRADGDLERGGRSLAGVAHHDAVERLLARVALDDARLEVRQRDAADLVLGGEGGDSLEVCP